MSDITLDISVVDEFSKKLDDFDARLRKLEGNAAKLDRQDKSTSKSLESVGKSADRAGGMFKGLGATMMIANQAMQAMQRIAGALKDSLEDVSQKERAVIMLGQEAGQALSDFAADSARTLGRSQSDIMKAAMRWNATGIGGNDIMEMTKITDRFANLNGKTYEEVSQALNDAVKSKNVGGLAELLGGGEGVERKLQRAGVERKLRSGNVAGAMESFKEVADGFGYTQEKADKMGMTVSRKMERMADRIKDKFTNLFSGIIQKAEPVIDRVLGWLESEEVDIFFDNLSTDIANLIDLIANAADLVGDTLGNVTDAMADAWGDAVGESVSGTETIVGVLVGGFTALGGYIYNAASKLWDWLLTGAESVCAGIVTAYRKIKGIISGEADQNEMSLISGQLAEQQRKMMLGGAEIAIREGNAEAARMYLDGSKQLGKAVDGVVDSVNKSLHEFDWSNLRFDAIDVDQRAAENIKGVMDWINGHSEDNRKKESRDRDIVKKKLGNIAGDTSKIRGAMAHEQDLRWLKERAEQHAVNEVNVRQLTPTINVRIEGGNVTSRDVERTIKKVLDEEVNAGTFNAYGEIA